MYKLKDGTIVSDPQWIMSDEWVKDRVAEKINEAYKKDEQDKLNRLANAKSLGLTVSDIDYQAFLAFHNFAEAQRNWGQEQKDMYAERRLNVAELIADI
jgi:hypothetical protein